MRTSLCLALLLASACSDPKPAEPAGGPADVAELGVRVELPAGWKYEARRGGHWVMKDSLYAAQLETVDMPASLDEAVKGWLSGTVSEKGEHGGGYFAVIEAEFPTGDGAAPMKLPYVYVVLPLGEGGIQCGGQLQAGDDPKAMLGVCKSMTALSK